ncbi:MAG: hypothetical protein ACRENN_02765 [Candidatus Eiseniibacteriota bacterium]
MRPTRTITDTRHAILAATVVATSMIAYQVGAKATRDAFFLSNFPVTALPAMVLGTSALAITLAYGATRALSAWGPERVIPTGFGVSAVLLLAEWGLSFHFPKPAAVLVYLHYGCLGALLISGFWSFLNERFDPRTAKLQLGRITAGGTVGGLLGGLVASLVGRSMPLTTMLPLLAVFHLICAAGMMRLRTGDTAARPGSGSKAAGSGSKAAGSGPDAGRVSRTGTEPVNHLRVLAGSPYLRNLVSLVLLVTLSEGLIDLVLKGRASGAYGGAGSLLRFFAAFYTGISFLTVIVQATVSRFALQRLGPARVTAFLPAGVAVASVGGVVVPGLASAVVASATESVLSNSLYRAGYELLFTPIAAREKRAIKALADVGASKLGGFVAAALAQAVVMFWMPHAGNILFGVSAVAAAAAFVLALRLNAGYKQSLARAVVSRADELDLSGAYDSATRSTMLRTLGPMALTQVVRTPRGEPSPEGAIAVSHAFPEEETLRNLPRVTLSEGATEEDGDAARIRDLRSRDLDRVRRALGAGALDAPVVPYVVMLLAWDEAARDAIAALRQAEEEATQLLVAGLINPDEDFAIRRRVPLILAFYHNEISAAGLMGGLGDRRFEVRYRCGRALTHRCDLDAAFHVPREVAFQAVLHEVETGAGVWKGRQLLDRMDDESWSPVMDEVVRDRANRSLEHVFTLLALALPRQPLKIAFRGLHTDDPLLRGTALEYLETALPSEIRKPLWPFLEDNRPKRVETHRSPKEALQALLDSRESIVLRLEDLKRKD